MSLTAMTNLTTTEAEWLRLAEAATPTRPGFYWALWRNAATNTHEGDQLTPANDWEVVEVWENFSGEPCEADAAEKFGVSVPGVRESQWLDNFKWGPAIASREAVPALAAALSEARDFAKTNWRIAHELMECGHPRACWQDRNFPASEQNYKPERKTSDPPIDYRCIACEQLSEARERLRRALGVLSKLHYAIDFDRGLPEAMDEAAELLKGQP